MQRLSQCCTASIVDGVRTEDYTEFIEYGLYSTIDFNDKDVISKYRGAIINATS